MQKLKTLWQNQYYNKTAQFVQYKHNVHYNKAALPFHCFPILAILAQIKPKKYPLTHIILPQTAKIVTEIIVLKKRKSTKEQQQKSDTQNVYTNLNGYIGDI